jgi:hypothetical protein
MNTVLHKGMFCQFASGFTTMAVMNPPEKKLEKCTYVRWSLAKMSSVIK